MIGILTDCITEEKTEVELKYEVEKYKNINTLYILNGVIGHKNNIECFELEGIDACLKVMCEEGCVIYGGFKGKRDGLFITADEIKKVLKKEGFYKGNEETRINENDICIGRNKKIKDCSSQFRLCVNRNDEVPNRNLIFYDLTREEIEEIQKRLKDLKCEGEILIMPKEISDVVIGAKYQSYHTSKIGKVLSIIMDDVEFVEDDDVKQYIHYIPFLINYKKVDE